MHIFVLKQAPHKIHMCEKILLAYSSWKRDDSNKAKIHDFLGLPLTLSTIYGVTLNLLFSAREYNYSQLLQLRSFVLWKAYDSIKLNTGPQNFANWEGPRNVLYKNIKYVNYIDQSWCNAYITHLLYNLFWCPPKVL